MKSKYVLSERFRISTKNPEMQMVEKYATEKIMFYCARMERKCMV